MPRLKIWARALVLIVFVGGAAGGVSASAQRKTEGRRAKAVLFDAFVIFDPRPVVARAEELFPGHGVELCDEWRVRQFEYTWLRSLDGRYADFWKVTEDALVYAAKKKQLDLTEDKRHQLMDAYLHLKAWPDARRTLRSLKKAGYQVGFLSNFPPTMLAANIKNDRLTRYFDQVLSTDDAGVFKPAPRAYQLGVDRFLVPKDQIVFVAFAGWDAAGAKSFGYRTFWVNRAGQLREELDQTPDGEGRDLDDLLHFLGGK